MDLGNVEQANGLRESDSRVDFKSQVFGKVQHEIERELRFLVPSDRLHELQRIPGATLEVITQHSFPESAFFKVARSLPKDLARELFEDIEVRRARIRHIKSKVEDTFLVQTKSPKRHIDGIKVERDEPTLEISRDLFRQLLPLATDGSLSKQRYVAVGSLFGDSSSIELHADILLAAGRIGKDYLPPPISPAQMPGFIAEIEFRTREQLRAIRAGRHSFGSLLQDCVLLSEVDDKSRKALSSSRLAREGFDELAQRRMHKLLRAN